MRTSAVAFAALLLLLLLATRAHGIRLNRQLHEAITSKEMAADPKPGTGESSIVDSVKKHCAPEGRCSSAAGKAKKALAHTDETAEAKQQQIGSTVNNTTVDAGATQQAGRREAEAASHGSPDDASAGAASSSTRVVARQRQTYPDLMEIAGMDYSPASRKPPIHN